MKLLTTFFIGLLFLLSCTTTKRSFQRQSARSDTTITKHTRVELRDTAVYSSRIVKDTTIVVPTRVVTDTVDATKPGATVKRQNGATLITNVLPDGQVAIKAECDSLLFVLEGQIIELERTFNSLYVEKDSTDLKSFTIESSEATKSKKTGLSIGAWLGIAFIILVLGFRLFYKFKFKI